LPKLFRCGIQTRTIASRDHQRVAFARKNSGHSQTDAARSAGDECNSGGNATAGGHYSEFPFPLRISARNSSRVFSEARKVPSMCDVTAEECCFSTPRIMTHR